MSQDNERQRQRASSKRSPRLPKTFQMQRQSFAKIPAQYRDYRHEAIELVS
jgi:hypothetical protein